MRFASGTLGCRNHEPTDSQLTWGVTLPILSVRIPLAQRPTACMFCEPFNLGLVDGDEVVKGGRRLDESIRIVSKPARVASRAQHSHDVIQQL